MKYEYVGLFFPTFVTRFLFTSWPFYNHISSRNHVTIKMVFRKLFCSEQPKRYGQEDTAICLQMVEQWQKKLESFYIFLMLL